MVHHDNSKIDCPSCSLKLNDAHPLLRPYFINIRTKFPDCHIACTFRDQIAQEEAFRDGSSKKHWPNSKHNIIINGKPQSRALDFFQQVNGLTKYPYPWVMEVIKYCRDQKYPFRYGIDFPKLEDSIHIELLDSIL